MNADLLQIAALILAVWRLAYMFVTEDGPFDVFDGLRKLANRTRLDGLFACVYCMSVYTSAALIGVVLLVGWLPVYWLALSAAVMFVQEAFRYIRGKA